MDAQQKIKRQDKLIRLDELKPYEFNNRNHPAEQVEMIARSLQEFGWTNPILVDENMSIIAGHGRFLASLKLGMTEAPCVILSGLTEEKKRAYRILDNKLTEDSTWAMDNLSLEVGWLEDQGFDVAEWGLDELVEGWNEDEQEAEEDGYAGEVPDETFLKLGDLLELGRHRVMCGDSTDADQVSELMNGKKAQLIHADPPYGMGKEKDGVQNDNLYADKLDSFQIEWWKTFRPHAEDNGSFYIWGNAEDLWRLWYIGGLKDSERLTFRNEIIWNKGHGHGMISEQHRMYPTATERCLFFMLGEQGFNNNADNYWKGWDSIVNYLRAEKEKTGWDTATFKRLAGHSEASGCHWFDKSQWSLPTKDVYNSWQKAAKGKAFKREHDELKQTFYSTRAYFDNTHESMTDVWDFPRVTGEERQGHATPKPVTMICRAIKSSTRDGEIIAEPFLGSGTTLIAAEQLNRTCYGMEISPKYCQVILDRYIAHCLKSDKKADVRINGEVYNPVS